MAGHALAREYATRGLALAESDMVVITAGSSVSARDMTVAVIAGLGAPGVLLGWSGFLRRKVQAEAAKGLAAFQRKR